MKTDPQFLADLATIEGAFANVLESLKGAKAEIEAMEFTYDDYCPSGKLMDQIDEAIKFLETEAL